MTLERTKKRNSAKSTASDSFSAAERRLLRSLGLSVNKRLHMLGKSVENLVFEQGIARSTLREIIAGRSNSRILTLSAIARGLGYRNPVDFLQDSETH